MRESRPQTQGHEHGAKTHLSRNASGSIAVTVYKDGRTGETLVTPPNHRDYTKKVGKQRGGK